MKPQKKAVVGRKATGTTTVAKKRRVSPDKLVADSKSEKKVKKLEKPEETRRKLENEKKRQDKPEDKKKQQQQEERRRMDKFEENKKRMEEKRKEEKMEKLEDKRKQNRDNEKRLDKLEEKRNERSEERGDEREADTHDNVEKKKMAKHEEKSKVDNLENGSKYQTSADDKDPEEDKVDSVNSTSKKKSKEEKRKDVKAGKPESKENFKSMTIKDNKKLERKKTPEKEMNKKSSPAGVKKDTKVKQTQKKAVPKKTVLAKKMASHSPVVGKKLLEKNVKLVKASKSASVAESEEDENEKKTKKKNSLTLVKGKVPQDKGPKLAKQMKAKIGQKQVKMSATLKKEGKLKRITEKIVMKKKVEAKESEKITSEVKKASSKDESVNQIEANNIKREIDENKDERTKDDKCHGKLQDSKKCTKNAIRAKVMKKPVKKITKPVKTQSEENDRKSTSSDEVTLDELLKKSKVSEEALKNATGSRQEHGENLVKTDLKVEAANAEASNSSSSGSSNSDEEDENESPKKNRRRMAKKKERKSSPSDERARRMRLFGFWSGPKRHRVASLNALAKVHCLYENEAGGVYLGGFCKPKPEKEKQKKAKEEKEESKDKDKEKDSNLKKNESAEENAPKRKLRNVPGLRGKHWDMIETSSSSSSSSDEDYEQEKSVEPNKKKIVKRRKKNEEVMDLKDMVVCKRMASLNASAILAASYSDEKNRQGSSSSSSNDSTSESEVEVIKRRKQSDSEVDKRKSRQGSDSEEVIKPSKKVVIVNQDTDVTITGVYVNQTRSTHHEGFCSIAGMQYRISSTSHTQTAATAVATELHDQPKLEQPCKSYTPLGALSSMQPPGSQGNHPPMSPRRHSAFSAPHQHGYYQPAGPLIQHPPTLPPVKGPPPEPTPTPPQNSEGSDDLVATSTTSGGTSSSGNGGFYRAYCPQYYGTPPQYQELCYPPTYSHPHPHPPPYYKYAPTYRRQYYGYQESGGGGGPGGGGAVGGPGVVEYQPPPPSAEYPPPPYYGGYPPPPPPPPPNPAYLHTQGRPFVDHAAFQGCPCPMQSCPKNVDTGPLIGNGKGAPVVSGPGLSLPPSALVGPPSPARGLAGLAPPHGANAWDTDRVKINTHRNLNQNQPPLAPTHSLPGGPHVHPQNSDCRTKDEKTCQDDKLRKCSCQKHACTSTCEVKMETLSPTDKLTVTTCPSSKLRNFKLENNNVKCESCSVESVGENLPCAANCEVKCESGYKCEIIKCEQCMKEGQMTILEIDKDSGILMIDDKLETEPDVKEEMNDVVVIENDNWKKPDYESTVQETVEDKEATEISTLVPEEEEEQPRCQKVTKRKLSLDSLSDNIKKRKVNKRTLSVGSARDLNCNDPSSRLTIPTEVLAEAAERVGEPCATKKKQAKKEVPNQKRKTEGSSPCETPAKKPKSSKQTVAAGCVANCLKNPASETSIMETINNVIQQSLQMTQRKDRKMKSGERVEKKKSVNLISTTLKKVTKKMDLVKAAVSEKLNFAKCETKLVQPKSKVDAKSKTKTQDAKSKTKVKAKIVEVKCKVLDSKSKVQDLKSKDTSTKRHENQISKPPKVTEILEESKKACLVKKRRKSTKKTSKKSCKMEDSLPAEENLSLIRKPYLKPKWSNGWSWEGESYEAKVYLTNEESAIRRCYTIMKHESGDVLRPRDCVLLKSGPRKADLPFVAKIAALWENPDDGEMMFSLLWYYRPEHTEQGRTEYDTEDEVFASRHRDANSVACIEDKCYILTFNEYCRYRKNLRRIEEGLESPGLIVPRGDQVYPREHRQPPIPVPSDMVLFCRRVYDYRGKKLVKNPG